MSENFFQGDPTKMTKSRKFCIFVFVFSVLTFIGGLSPSIFTLLSIFVLPAIMMSFVGLIDPKRLPKETVFHWYLLTALVLSIVFTIVDFIWLFFLQHQS
jgi:hypothetical protein